VKRIFISKNEDDLVDFGSFCEENKLTLVAKSLITFEAVDFKLTSEFDCIFFSSIRAATFFFEKKPFIPRNILFACSGKETARKLSAIGITSSFIGSESGNPEKVSLDFAKWLKERKVLFPHSNLSKFSALKNLSEKQCSTVLVYKTCSIPAEIPNCSVYVFTSPSNVSAFLINNRIPKDAFIIAYGKSTREHLNSLNIACLRELRNVDLSDLKKGIIKELNIKKRINFK
jgi:uroporphyrinogen-III synthase